ncbi:hypothetical protein Poli38472_009284 [Pythium oligandrum]|uniref:WRKY19-like zinc finger domain-containing protein n=1 Tax=Pythium oligandrum TaxID=41045 RepID=A0A8K1FMQ9_PYTOL|nr:hypothetical protein Poli38472_009284 [Pythium oligandrum]|eukprot:TMW65117.1 hypothetical protein Poli38472_009284 [Pythium oligandrum]
MNWTDGVYQVAGADDPRQEEIKGELAERDIDEANAVLLPRVGGAYPSRSMNFSLDRYGTPTLTHEGNFILQDLSTGQPAMGCNSSNPPQVMDMMSHGLPYNLQSSLDMHHFEDNAAVELQQLFPNPASSSVQVLNNTSNSYYGPHPSLPSEHGVSSMDSFNDAAFQPFQPAPDQAHMLVPFPFTAMPPSSVLKREDLGIADSGATSLEMHEVSTLFDNSATLMTPPTTFLAPRTSIVSPINAYGQSRNLLTPPFRDSELLSLETGSKFSPDRRKLCCVEGCKSQARAFNRCKRHGGSKRCSHAGCTKSVQSRGLCIRHGGGSRCQEIGCTRAAQSHGKCKMHGGGRPCIIPGCEKKAHLKRLCRKHGGGAKCSLAGCDKWAQRQGMCMTHSKHVNPMDSSSPQSSNKYPARPTIDQDSII